jgi:hypothetical protein
MPINQSGFRENPMRERASILESCRCCLRLSNAEVCRECLDHKQKSGHLPGEVFWRQIPGQPRAVVRFCGKCGAALQASYGT